MSPRRRKSSTPVVPTSRIMPQMCTVSIRGKSHSDSETSTPSDVCCSHLQNSKRYIIGEQSPPIQILFATDPCGYCAKFRIEPSPVPCGSRKPDYIRFASTACQESQAHPSDDTSQPKAAQVWQSNLRGIIRRRRRNV